MLSRSSALSTSFVESCVFVCEIIGVAESLLLDLQSDAVNLHQEESEVFASCSLDHQRFPMNNTGLRRSSGDPENSSEIVLDFRRSTESLLEIRVFHAKFKFCSRFTAEPERFTAEPDLSANAEMSH